MKEEFEQKKMFISLLFENMEEIIGEIPEDSVYRKGDFESWKPSLARLASWLKDLEGPSEFYDDYQNNSELSEEKLCNKIWEGFETKVNVLSDLFKSYRNQTNERNKMVFLSEIINTINF